MDTARYDHPAPTPGPDTWTSPLWGSPDTVGGFWTDERTEPVYTAPPAPPAPPTGGRPGRLALVAGALVVAALLLVGLVRALPSDDAASASRPTASPTPRISAPAQVPTPTPSASDPGSGDDILPSLPAIPGLPGSGQQPGDSSSTASGTSAHPEAVAAVAPGLVNITTTVGYDGNEAAGTGVVLTSDGIILTNHHVIAGSTSIKAAVAGTSKSYTAKVLGYDASHDIAVIQLTGASGLTVAPLGDSGTVKVGDVVIGLGNAGGAGGKPIPADGKVTGLNRSITAMNSENGTSEDLTGLIETDASIRPGDSGGALVSADGKVVGIITAGSVSSSVAANGTDGYAVPINQALAIAQDIRDGKASATVHIGESAFLGITVAGGGTATNGVRVAGTVAGSAAARIGLKAGDRITALDGRKVTDNTSLRTIIAPHHPGDTVSITWVDTSGRSHSTDVTFGSGPVA